MKRWAGHSGRPSIHLLCRHCFPITSRYASSSSSTSYVLPRLVIDLDAADSKFVRKAEFDARPAKTLPQVESDAVNNKFVRSPLIVRRFEYNARPKLAKPQLPKVKSIAPAKRRPLASASKFKLPRKAPLKIFQKTILPIVRTVQFDDAQPAKPLPKAKSGAPPGTPPLSTFPEPLSTSLPIVRKVQSNAPEIKLVREVGSGQESLPTLLDPKNITPVDLLSYALFGDVRKNPNKPDGEKSSSQQSYFLGRILGDPKHYIPANDEALIIRQMVDTFYAQKPLEIGVLQNAISESLRFVFTFPYFQRVISIASSVRLGCEFLASPASNLNHAIRSCERHHTLEQVNGVEGQEWKQSLWGILNNLCRRLESYNIELGADLCNLGIYYASKMRPDFPRDFSTTKRYLEIAKKYGYQTSWRTSSALYSWFVPLIRDGKREESQVRKSLELITGLREEPNSGQVKLTGACFRSLNDRYANFWDSVYVAYIQSLGHAGLSDLLWHEWISTKFDRTDPGVPVVICGSMRRRFRSQIFAIAFLMAKDSKRALAALESVPVSHKDTPSPSISKYPDQLEAMIRYHYGISGIHYKLEPLQRLIGNEYAQAKISKTLQNLPDKPEECLEVLKSLLVIEMPGSDQSLPSYLDLDPETDKLTIGIVSGWAHDLQRDPVNLDLWSEGPVIRGSSTRSPANPRCAS